MSTCPLNADGVHRGLKCACGSEMVIPPICVSFDVMDGSDVLVSDGFNCNGIGTAAAGLRRAADKLDALARTRGEV